MFISAAERGMPEETVSAFSGDKATAEVHLTPSPDFGCHHPVGPRDNRPGDSTGVGELVNSLPRRVFTKGSQTSFLRGMVPTGGP